MANVSYPGVYVEEVSSGVRPIQAASTSVAAFIGMAKKGPLDEAVKVYNFTEYQNLYGGFLSSSYLSHAVYQFFNNGGTQCYIVRVSGENVETASIDLNDRGAVPQPTLKISACSSGVWGNDLAVVIGDGTNDPGNEFNLSVYHQDGNNFNLLEKFVNLSMVPSASNFVVTVTTSSNYIRVTALPNANVGAGTSQGSAVASPLTVPDMTRFNINIDGDGYQEVNLQDAVGIGADQIADLSTVDNICQAIIYVVSRLTKQHASTNQGAFDISCTPDGPNGSLLLRSGASSFSSSVTIAPANNINQNATGLLKLGKLQGGIETLGAAITRPINNPTTPTISYYYIGDNTTPAIGVASVLKGSDGDPITNDNPYIDAFNVLDDKEDVSLIAVPGNGGTTAVVGAGLNYCANRSLSDCFFIGDMGPDEDSVAEAKTFMNAITPKNSYGAVYTPWIKMLDPTGQSSEPILVPPSGYVAGLYAKTDAQRGVWKAPAGTSAALGRAVGLAVNFTDVQQGNLNPVNINVIRQFAASGIVLWGARTIHSDAEYKYIPVRRMAIFLRVSIYRSIQWAVFEPNDEPLWGQLRLNIGAFMMNLFRQGAFQGSTPSKAFFVKCDSETTTQNDINLGIVNVLVGFAPLKPAEFVVVKISQMVGQVS